MSTIEVILSKRVKGLGYTGDTVTVRRGYARNFLFANELAIESKSRNAKMLEHQKRRILAAASKEKGEAKGLAEQVGAHTLDFKLKISEGGRSYGSIGNKDVASALQKLGYDITRKQVVLSEQVKMPGSYVAKVRLHSDVATEVKLEVTADKPLLKKVKNEDEEDAVKDGEQKAEAGEDGVVAKDDKTESSAEAPADTAVDKPSEDKAPE